MNESLLQKLNQTKEAFEIDEISEEELTEIVCEPNSHYISNLKSWIVFFLKKGANPSFIAAISKKAAVDEDFREALIQSLEIPTQLTAYYIPSTGEFDYEKTSFFNTIYLNCIVQQKTKNALNNIDLDGDTSIPITLTLHPKSLFHYIENIDNSNRFSKICKNSKIFVASMVAGMILCNTFSSATIANEIKARKQTKITVSHSLKKINTIASNFEHNLNGAIEELNKMNNHLTADRASRLAQELSTEELNNLFKNLNHSFEDNSGSASREQLGTDKVEDIIEIIREFSKRRDETTEKIAQLIYKESEKQGIDYKLMTAVIMAESSFEAKPKPHMNTNGTTDFSIAQINYETWSVELYRVKKIKISKQKLQSDLGYSVEIMGDIMNVLHKRYKNNRQWYSYYHSKTPSKRAIYLTAVNKKLQFIKKVEINNTKEKIENLLGSLTQIDQDYNPHSKHVDFDKVNGLVASLHQVKSLIDVETIEIDKLLASK